MNIIFDYLLNKKLFNPPHFNYNELSNKDLSAIVFIILYSF